MIENPNKNHEKFDLFVQSYKPLIRPKDTLTRMVDAFQLNARFQEEFRYLRPYLPRKGESWADEILKHLCQVCETTRNLEPEALSQIQKLYRDHSMLFRVGRFGEDYLDSIETIALFFIYHDIKTIWLSSAYHEAIRGLTEIVCARASRNKSVPLRYLLNSLFCALSVEQNQIQRTFTVYERHVGATLVKDLSKDGSRVSVRAASSCG